MEKEYLGDSVYAEFDGDMVRLTTNNGRSNDPSNTIYLKYETAKALLIFFHRVAWPKMGSD